MGKKILKIAGIILGGFVLLIAGFMAFIAVRGIPSYDPPPKLDLKVEITPERVAHGQNLAAMICINCHKAESGPAFTGKKMMDLPTEFGEVFAANITQHKTYGIGKWTDGEIYYLLRTGLKPDGTYIPPYMPKFYHTSDEDLYSVIAFLRSDAFAVQAADVIAPRSKPGFMTKFLCAVAFKPMPLRDQPIIAPDTTDKVAFGRYLLVGRYDCYQCHSASFKTNNAFEPELSPGYLGGGNLLLNMEQQTVVSPNITPDEETGLGKWTEAEFIQAVKWGKGKNGNALKYPMIPFSTLKDSEVAAIWAYLQTVPKLKGN